MAINVSTHLKYQRKVLVLSGRWMFDDGYVRKVEESFKPDTDCLQGRAVDSGHVEGGHPQPSGVHGTCFREC